MGRDGRAGVGRDGRAGVGRDGRAGVRRSFGVENGACWVQGRWVQGRALVVVGKGACWGMGKGQRILRAPTPPAGSRHSCQPTVKLRILPLVLIFHLCNTGIYLG